MKFGVIPGWLCGCVIASILGIPFDLAYAGAAIGIVATVAFITRTTTAPIILAAAPVICITVRYLVLPLVNHFTPDDGGGTLMPLLQDAYVVLFIMSSWAALFLASTLAICGSYTVGLRWAYSTPHTLNKL